MITRRHASERFSGEGRTLAGLAVPYGKWSGEIAEPGVRGTFQERISRGAFGDLEGADIKLLYNHQGAALLARTKSGTLRLKDTAGGLRFDAELPETTLGNDVRELIQRGDLTGEMSFGFYVEADEWNDKRTLRTVTKARLVELSVVVDAAYGTNTSSELRSVADRERNARTIYLRAQWEKTYG
jgi:HK97 family phage prohead protease